MNEDTLPAFAKLVAASFQALAKDQNVFVVNLSGDALYAEYLAAFPDGTNPVFKKNTEHDCSSCKHFIRRAGIVVCIEDGALRTVWDQAAERAPAPYREVAARLRDVVRAAHVAGPVPRGREGKPVSVPSRHDLSTRIRSRPSRGITSTPARSHATYGFRSRTRRGATTAPPCRSSSADSSN